MSYDEWMEIFDYLLVNYDDLVDNIIFNRDFLIKIRNVVKGKIPNNFNLNNEQKEAIINHFLNSGISFNVDTPTIIINDLRCINQAISIDINSVDYIIEDNLNKEEITNIINELLKCKYVLNEETPKILKQNEQVILNSIKIDINSYKYADYNISNSNSIFSYLLMNNYGQIKELIELINLDMCTDLEIFSKCLTVTDLFNSNNQIYINRFTYLFYSGIKKIPTIKSFNEIVDYIALKDWEEYRNNHLNEYSNIYNKICLLCRKSDNIDTLLEELEEIGYEMENILKDKYILLKDTVKECYILYHGDKIDYQRLPIVLDTISKLSSLYIAKSLENYKSKLKKLFYESIRKYYVPKLDNPIINKRIKELKCQSYFKSKYLNGDIEINNYINSIINKYSIYGDWVRIAIDKFIIGRIDFNNIIKQPLGYSNYLRYRSASKLVNRLNLGYLKYSDIDIFNYQDIIVYEDNKYICNLEFSTTDLKLYKDYYNKEQLFNKIKKEIVMYINTIKVPNDFNINYNNLLNNLPFNDNYYIFDYNNFLKDISFTKMCECLFNKNKGFNELSFINDEVYNNLYNFMINNNIIWLLLFDNYGLRKYKRIGNIANQKIVKLINNYSEFIKMKNDLKINVDSIKTIMSLSEILDYCSSYDIALLGYKIISILYTDKKFLKVNSQDIIKIAKELIIQMATRNKSTIPYVSGIYHNYKYGFYDSQDEDVLINFHYTDSCFKVCGNDNDFFHYSMIDKNGFVIKITDSSNNFIGRAAGFRCGNYLYINQFRTIYDINGDEYNGDNRYERSEIINTLICMCNEIISESYKNSKDKIKIDYIFVTRSYIMNEYPFDNNLSNQYLNSIGKIPMNIHTTDWRLFVENTKNLTEVDYDEFFTTDYNNYPLICIASSKSLKKIVFDDGEAVYDRPRNKIIVTTNIDDEILRKINKIRCIYAYYHNTQYTTINIDNNSIIVIGDNWYLIYNNGIIDYCIQDFDSKAINEFETISNLLLENNNENVLPKIKKITVGKIIKK